MKIVIIDLAGAGLKGKFMYRPSSVMPWGIPLRSAFGEYVECDLTLATLLLHKTEQLDERTKVRADNLHVSSLCSRKSWHWSF